jgi:hypothetical protein
MSKKYPYIPGELIYNKESDILFLVEKVDKNNIYLVVEKENRHFIMPKYKFKEQLETGKEEKRLIHYPVVK